MICYCLVCAGPSTTLNFVAPLTLKQVGGDGGSALPSHQVVGSDSACADCRGDRRNCCNADGGRVYRIDNLTSQSVGRDKGEERILVSC